MLPQGAWALPLPKPGQLGALSRAAELAKPSPLLEDGVNFAGIIALNNCSASLVRLETSLPDDKALVLTNGHCNENGFSEPGESMVDYPSSRTMRLLSPDGQSTLARLQAERIVYATMTKTDMLLYRLNETYDSIERRTGTRALTLRSQHPKAERKMAVVSGYWKKIYRCSVDRFIPTLREDHWTWEDSIKYLQPGCETIGGTSGSPILDVETHEVIGVNNTGNEDGEKCTMNNPCEVDSQGNVTFEKGTSYGQETYWVYGCMDANGTLDLTRPGCQLPH